jgi:Reverse transcriptase (RNA-dependent DNA polymerase)
MIAEELDEYALVAETSEVEAIEPRSLAEARCRPNWELWEKGIIGELALLKEAGTWELTTPPENANIVGSKWVFRAKKDAAGNVVRYKARLITQGFSQVPGVDYFDMFAPVAKLASIRTVLALAAAKDMEIHQIEIKGTYLNGELTDQETIYMAQPPGYHAQNSAGKVCRLRKTLYGLKQSGRRWYQKLVEIMTLHLAVSRCNVDQAVFFHRNGQGSMIILVHVDDCTIAASSKQLIGHFKAKILERVEITDLGELHWLLGIEVRRNRERHTIHFSQRSYITSILRHFNLEELKPTSTPMQPGLLLYGSQTPKTTAEWAQMHDTPYREAIGSLMYAALGTRPDIAFAVHTLSRYSTKFGPAHWNTVKWVFSYLKGTKELWLTYGQTQAEMMGYADADGSTTEDRHAVTGYAFIINSGAVSWSAKCQSIISLSMTESEYVAAAHATKEALWLRSLIEQLFDEKLSPTTLFSDNQSAIALAKDHQYHA